MCCSPPTPERRGLSLAEVLVSVAILAVAMVPIVDLFIANRRAGHSAQRLVDVTLHAQMVLEAIAQLKAQDLPPLAQGTDRVLFGDGLPDAPGGTGQFSEVARYFREAPVKVKMDRIVVASRLATGELLLRMDVSWDSVVGEEKTRRTLNLHMLSMPRNWR